MKNAENGFTLVETLIATAVVGVLAAIAIPSYSYYINRTQVSEAFRLMDAQRANIEKIQKNKSCTFVDGVADTYKGKYGILTVSGTYTPSTGLSCPTGCNAVYTLNGTGVSKGVADTVVAAQILNNGKLSKTVSATTAPDKYLPTEFKTIGASAGDVCSKITDDPLVPTGGSLPTGTDTGEVAPTPTPTPIPTPTPGPSPTPTPGPTPTPVPTPGPSPTPTPPKGLPDELTKEEQVALAKTWDYKLDFTPYSSSRNSTAMGVYIPADQHPDFYNRANWVVTGGRYSSDGRNTHWYNNKFIKNKYQIAWAGTSNANSVVVRTDCAEGGGCGNIYGYYAEVNFYYKGVLVKTARSGVFTPEGYSG